MFLIKSIQCPIRKRGWIPAQYLEERSRPISRLFVHCMENGLLKK